ncbi:MAG: hypothetical protein OXU31_06715 [Gammaproteobacteria bacterium]|nr:hypothetical protein [Gammaproteobacteria bacterium]
MADKRKSALGGGAPKKFSCAGFTVTELRPSAIAQLSGAPAENLRVAFSLAVAPRAGGSAAVDGARFLWNGPGMFLAVAGGAAPEAWCEQLSAALPEAAVTDLSHARCVLRLAGAAAADVLATGCPVDCGGLENDSSFASHFGHFNVLVDFRRREEMDLYAPRSFGEALWGHLRHLGVEFG